MRKFNYIAITLVNSVGFLTIFSLLVIMQIDFGKQGAKITSLEVNYSKSRDAYTRFINGRTLNSDYNLWKELDSRFNVYQLNKVSQSQFLKGVAVFQKAFWKKFNEKKQSPVGSAKDLNWENRFDKTDNEIKAKIYERFPQKEIIGKKLNQINNSIAGQLDMVKGEYQNIQKNLYIQYALFSAILIYCFTFYFRRVPSPVVTVQNNENEVDLEHVPTLLYRLDDDKIESFSGKVKELTPNIVDYENWNDYFLTNFSIVKNIGTEKIVSLRKKKTARYKLHSSINGRNRYISLSPVVTLLKETNATAAGNDSLKETIRESAYRIELLCPKVKIEVDFQKDILIDQSLVRRMEESMSMVGTFYKRLSDIQNRNISILSGLDVKRHTVKIYFETEGVRLDPNLLKNISNFNFSFYPQKIEDILSEHDGSVTLKNKYTTDKKFASSSFQIQFNLGTSKYKLNQKSREQIGTSN